MKAVDGQEGWMKMKDSSSFRAGEMRPQWPLSFGFSVIELSRNNPEPEDSRGDALRNARAEGLEAKRMLRVSNTLHILESLDCGSELRP